MLTSNDFSVALGKKNPYNEENVVTHFMSRCLLMYAMATVISIKNSL